MSHLPPIISDLALILLVAGVVTIIFRKLKQPLVLGYIVAGFLASPHMPYMPSVHDEGNIAVWSEIGVIFLMFVLGLEFSLKKIASMGMRPIIAGTLSMLAMIGVGNTVGHLLGWSNFDSLFLGGVLGISSTTIIYKALEDLGWLNRRFAQEVFSVLIIEDILGILLMIVLSTLGATSSQAAAGHDAGLLTSLGTLAFFLVLWFVVGIYVVPFVLKKNRKIINSEILLVVSLGLCFGLVVLADQAGFSAAFGAFVMGSILAETVEAERIEKLVSPVRDLFGAVFFVSVGMLVDPNILLEYWWPIVAISLALFAGKAIFGTLAFVIAGNPLQRAMQSSFSLTQIGEFSFIIAALGETLGVTSKFLYPIVVAVSIVTTFLTPYMIRTSAPAYQLLERLVPRLTRRRDAAPVSGADTAGTVVSSATAESLAPSATTVAAKPSAYFVAVVLQTVVYAVLGIAVTTIVFRAILPLLRQIPPTHYIGNAIAGLFLLVVISVFVRPIVARKNNSLSAQQLRTTLGGRVVYWATIVVRWAAATAGVYYILNYLSPLWWELHVALSLLLVWGMVKSRWVKYQSILMERRFMHNLRQRETVAQHRGAQQQGMARRLSARDVHFARLTVPPFSEWAGQTLAELDLGAQSNAMVVAILRQDLRLNAPDGAVMIYPGDVLEVIGDDNCLEILAQRMESEVTCVMDDDGEDHTLLLRRVVTSSKSTILPSTVAESGIRDVYRCMIVGVEDATGSIVLAEASRVLRPHDALWLVGEADALDALEKQL